MIADAIHDALVARGQACVHEGPEGEWPCRDLHARIAGDADMRGAEMLHTMRERWPDARVVIAFERAALGSAFTVEVTKGDDHYISMDTDLGHAITRCLYTLR